MIKVSEVTIKRGERTLIKDFSMVAPPGAITAITGPNGSGKSTLIDAISGDLAYQSGTVQIMGHEVNALDLSEQAELRSV
jgi:iron complex transport system ATP-binding protein